MSETGARLISNLVLLVLMEIVVMWGRGCEARGTSGTLGRGSFGGPTVGGIDRKIYFAIATESSAQAHTRAFNKTLSNITQAFSMASYNITLETLVIELPENGRFSSNFLERLCVQLEGHHVAAVLVVGSSPAAFTVALVASNSGIPILWARNDPQYTSALTHKELEVVLQPGPREMLEALRSLLVQTHWHSFTILADHTAAGVLLRRELATLLETAPLTPTVLHLPASPGAHAIFRRLADISRATRGVVVLMSDVILAKRVLDEAKRLNMVDGHFVWLWIDISFATNPASPESEPSTNKTEERSSNNRFRRQTYTKTDDNFNSIGDKNIFNSNEREESWSFSSREQPVPTHGESLRDRDHFDWKNYYEKLKRPNIAPSPPSPLDFLNDMNTNTNLLRNDKFLLLNPADRSVESSKFLTNNLFVNSNVNDKFKINQFSDNFFNSDKRVNNGLNPSSNDKDYNNNNSNNVKKRDVKFLLSGNVDLPVGLLALRALPLKMDRHLVRGAVRLLTLTLRNVLAKCPDWIIRTVTTKQRPSSCWQPIGPAEGNFSALFAQELRIATQAALAGHKLQQENGVEILDKSLVSHFEITNLVPEQSAPKDFSESLDQHFETQTGSENLRWRIVGQVTGRVVHLDTIVWPGGAVAAPGLSARARSVFRVVTALAPPFVMESELDEDGQCLRGLPCHRVLTSDKDNLTLVFNEMETQERLEEEDEDHLNPERDFQQEYEHGDKFLPFQRYKYRTNCCYGLAMDLLENIAQELEFDFRLYIVADGLYGAQLKDSRVEHRDLSGYQRQYQSLRYNNNGLFRGFGKWAELEPEMWQREKYQSLNKDAKWNGIVGDLISGAAHMSFAALSVSSIRSEVIDFSAPFFFSGVSFLAAPQQTSEIPLLAFLLPFSPELWIAIFTSLNITAIAVAVYEWLSPFGLNPWGRQRSKNFSMSSALWVMWGLLCGHLVAFKAPKSWPNKFLINVWGGFSVIFVASYTANIAALIAGLFFHSTVSNYHDRSLLSQKVGAPMASAAEYYVQRANRHLWDHMHRYSLDNVEDGVARLKNGSLDILIADTPILDYYRATDHGCKLQKIGDTINEDAYAVGMTKGFPLKDSISALIAKYSSNGYMDILQEKWYGGLPCFKLASDIDMVQPRPLGVAAVAGVFILLGLGMAMGCLILLVEHLFYRYTLPILRHKPKGTIWRSRNIMFFSQKLYRFINCVELVSPHHAARELVHTIRQGQITSLFQKSVKRKEHEQRRRRKSKAQFFEMIQEIRRVQQEERDHNTLEAVREMEAEDEQDEPNGEKRTKLSPNIIRRHFMRSNPRIDTSPNQNARSPSKKLFVKQIFSPRSKMKAKSASTLNVRRFSTDSVFNSNFNTSAMIGRRLSRDPTFLTNSPPDPCSRRSSNLDVAQNNRKLSGKSPVLSIENVSESSYSDNPIEMVRKLSDVESIGRKLATLSKFSDQTKKFNLSVDDAFNRRKSDIIIPPSKNKFSSTELLQVETAKSVQNIPDSTSKDEVQLNVSKVGKQNEDYLHKSKQTIQELQSQFEPKPAIPKRTTSKNPQIRIEIEDTSSAATVPAQRIRKLKQRHRSLGDTIQARQKIKEHSQSLDTNESKSEARKETSPRSRNSSTSQHSEDNLDLPPAPPPPNCSPRNSNGKSPLERLSKDELVLLWRSSESELRSHLLKALRDKDIDDPP